MTCNNFLDQLRDDGFCRIDNVIPADAVLDRYYDAFRILETCGILAVSYPRNMTWQLRALELMENVIDPSRKESILEEQFYVRPAVINDMPLVAAHLAEPRVVKLVDEILGRDARVMFAALYVHEPGTKRGPWHAGGPFNPDYIAYYPAPYANPAPHLTLHLLLSEFSEETGGILVVPGSHRRETNPGYEPRPRRFDVYADETRLTGPVGSAVIMDSRLWHAIAANPSDFPRASIVVECAPSERSVPPFLALGKCPALSRSVFEQLLPTVQRLFRQWVKSK